MTTPTDLPARVEEALAECDAAVTAFANITTLAEERRKQGNPIAPITLAQAQSQVARRKTLADQAILSLAPALAADWRRLRERERVLTEALRPLVDVVSQAKRPGVEVMHDGSMGRASVHGTRYEMPGPSFVDPLLQAARAALSPEPKT